MTDDIRRRFAQIALDTETTGLDPESGDRIIEIGCVRLDGRNMTNRSTMTDDIRRRFAQIALDTETTGLDPESGDRIIEIGCVRLDGRNMTNRSEDYLQLYINPERDIPEESTAIHGITNEKVANCPTFAQIADEFIEFIRGAELLIHNARFDIGFLNMELQRCGKGRVEDYARGITDTLEIAHELLNCGRIHRIYSWGRTVDSQCPIRHWVLEYGTPALW